MTTLEMPTEQQFVLEDVDWDFYEALLDQIGDRHVFVTFDEGRLEIMSPSREHDKAAELLAVMISVLAEELDADFSGGGSTTFRRKDLKHGLEPDKCFYVKNEPRIRGKRKIDLSVDPPPDFVVEVEISRRLLDRERIYATLGVPELWRYDGKRLRVQLLQEGEYQDSTRSESFPKLPIDEVHDHIQQGYSTPTVAWMRGLRRWIRQHAKK